MRDITLGTVLQCWAMRLAIDQATLPVLGCGLRQCVGRMFKRRWVFAWTQPNAVRRQTPKSTCGSLSMMQTSISLSSGTVDMGCQFSIAIKPCPTRKVRH
jgi:hypothetical protein